MSSKNLGTMKGSNIMRPLQPLAGILGHGASVFSGS